jgi:non-lysosomal glucosylceramidase
MRDPRFHCQHPLNSGQYVQMIYRQYLRTRDKRQLSRYFESVKRAVRYQYSLDDDGSGLVHDQPHVSPGEAWPANQFYDVWPWEGVSCYVAGTWLATLAAAKALGEAAGDGAFTSECAARLSKARRTYEERLWNGQYYRLWNNAQAGTTSEVVLANQLMAEWCAKVLGLGGVLPEAHVKAALSIIERLNFSATSYGLINGVTPEGVPYDTKVHPAGDHATHIFIGENLCAAGTFLYHGRRDVGLEIARRLWEALSIKTRAPWNQRCLINGRTGLPQWGDDYYSNLAIWTLPMALEGQSIAEFTQSGLVAKILAAAG